MCIYCENIKINPKMRRATELMKNLPIVDEFSEKEIIEGEEDPQQYIRRDKNKHYLVTEFADDEGTVISFEISFCPMCGRKLALTENEAERIKCKYADDEVAESWKVIESGINSKIDDLREKVNEYAASELEFCRNTVKTALYVNGYV